MLWAQLIVFCWLIFSFIVCIYNVGNKSINNKCWVIIILFFVVLVCQYSIGGFTKILELLL